MKYDYCVVGGGIVGLATAKALLERHPDRSLVLVEKESALAVHQTGHNSGVIHAGIYYPPGSLKAELCRKGAAATKAFAEEHGIDFEVCGKLLVATNPTELTRMEALLARSADNQLAVSRISAGELHELEPHISGVGALLVPSTGIIDYTEVCRALGRLITAAGGEIRLGEAVTGIDERADEVVVSTAAGEIHAERLVVCGGIQADRLARLAGLEIDFQMIPFRGEYYRLPQSRQGLVKHLIYPIPDPELPFLGVHLTRTIDGGITLGPSAVLGMAREGYPKFSFDAADVREYATFPGMWKVARANVRTGAREMFNSVVKRGYLRECRKYCPELTVGDMLPEPAGIRAQAVLRDGTLVHDFLFSQTARSLHVCNAPSPAATSALPIGEMIVDRLVTV